MHKILFLFFCMVHLNVQSSAELHPLSDEFIDAINRKQSSWRAGRNFGTDTPMSFIKNLLGWIPSNDTTLPTIKHELEGSEIPDHFDWRDKYPNCTTLRDIRDQGFCGSCWAFGTAAALSDRICIHSEGKTNVYISAENILSCSNCGSCQGGFPPCVYSYWKKSGVVSGGHYGSKQGCQPYEIPPCEHYIVGPRPQCTHGHPTPECKNTCQSGYSVPYEKDLHFASFTYRVHNDAKQIQKEIMTYGPVTAAFLVHADFLHYKSGVYKHVDGGVLAGHAIKIIGWGTENGEPYWLIANSWNTDWGEKGYLKFLRGENHCNIESDVYAGIPK